LTLSVVQIVTEALTPGLFNEPVPSRGVGTGIIIDQEGHILTNNHVIAGAQALLFY
jgi:serine protease Do